MFPPSSTSSKLRYVTSPGPSGTVVWQAWMTSPGNDTTPPPNTPKRVATSEAQVRQVLASAGTLNQDTKALKYQKYLKDTLKTFISGYVDEFPEDGRFDELLNNGTNALFELIQEKGNVVENFVDFLEELVDKLIDEATHRIGTTYDNTNPEEKRAFEECIENIWKIFNDLSYDWY